MPLWFSRSLAIPEYKTSPPTPRKALRRSSIWLHTQYQTVSQGWESVALVSFDFGVAAPRWRETLTKERWGWPFHKNEVC